VAALTGRRGGYSRPVATLRATTLPGAGAVIWLAVVVVLAAVAIWQGFNEARHLRSDIEAGTGRSRPYRELQPAMTVGLRDLDAFLLAERVIPRNDSFFVVTGRRTAVTDPLVLRWARPFARYRLFPRRLARTPEEADWILSYGGELGALGLHFRRIIPAGPGVQLAEVVSR
jgi:hypothetical protein